MVATADCSIRGWTEVRVARLRRAVAIARKVTDRRHFEGFCEVRGKK